MATRALRTVRSQAKHRRHEQCLLSSECLAYFSHKVIGRDSTGTYQTRIECESNMHGARVCFDRHFVSASSKNVKKRNLPVPVHPLLYADFAFKDNLH